MFYTLVTKMLVTKNKRNSFLKIFIIGSIAYILLHHYFYSVSRGELADKIKKYIYYLMMIDLAIAFLLYKWFSPTEPEEKNSVYSDDQANSIKKNLDDLKKMQEEAQKDTKGEKESPFMTREEAEKKKSSETKSIASSEKKKSKKQKSDNESIKNDIDSKKESVKEMTKDKDTEEDTQIPIFMGE